MRILSKNRLKIFLLIVVLLSSILFTFSKEKDFLSNSNEYNDINSANGLEEPHELFQIIKQMNENYNNNSDNIKIDNIRNKVLGDQDECLADENFIREKYESTIKSNNLNVDATIKRLRFIHGKCSPVLFVPGLLATQINLVINCGKIKRIRSIWDEINFYCGLSSLCLDNTIQSHTIWPNLDNSVFPMILTKTNKYNQCFGYFASYYNSPDACKGRDGINHCRYSEYIRVVPKGVTKSSDDKNYSSRYMDFDCGSKAISNFMAVTKMEYLINQLVGPTKGFKDLISMVQNIGYIEAFSFYSIPYDFRESQCNNSMFNKLFKYMVETMYNLTGKKVVIVSHSYGNNNTHFQLTNTNKDLRSKIAHFVSLAPPYTGSTKTEFFYTKGGTEFRKSLLDLSIVDISRFAQVIGLTTIPSMYSLSRFDYIKTLEKNYSQDKIIMEYKEIIKGYMKFSTCQQYYREHSYLYCDNSLRENFINFFKDEMSFMKDREFCFAETKNHFTHQNSFETNKYYEKEAVEKPINLLCDLKLFDYNNCASFKINRSGNPNYENSIKQHRILNDLCKFEAPFSFNKDLYYFDGNNKSRQDFNEFNQVNGLKQIDFDEIMTDLCDKNYAVKNKDCSSYLKSIYDFYDNQALKNRKEELMKQCENYLGNLEHPEVPLTLVYNRSLETKAGFIYDKSKNIDQARNEIYFQGGDGTVEADSSLFVGLKWLLDHKHNNKPKVQILDFCAPIRHDLESTKKYVYSTPNDLKSGKNYMFLNCDCIDKEINYYSSGIDKCSHSQLLIDSNIVNLVKDIITTQDHEEIDKDITKLVLKVGTNKQSDLSEKCLKIYDELFYEKFDFN